MTHFGDHPWTIYLLSMVSKPLGVSLWQPAAHFMSFNCTSPTPTNTNKTHLRNQDDQDYSQYFLTETHCPHSHRSHRLTHQGLSTCPVTMAVPPGHGQLPFWSNAERLAALPQGYFANVRNRREVSSATRGHVLLRNFGLRRPTVGVSSQRASGDTTMRLCLCVLERSAPHKLRLILYNQEM